MRVTNKMLSHNFLSDMRNNLNNMKRIQEQGTSGKQVRRPSDNPFKVSRIMQINSDIVANKQYNENIKDTINWLDAADTSLGQAGEVFKRVRDLLVSAGNAAYGSSERKAIKDEVNEKIEEFSQILNTSFDGKYIFGGTRGTSKPMDIVKQGENSRLVYRDREGQEILSFDDLKSKINNSGIDIAEKGTLNDKVDMLEEKMKMNPQVEADIQVAKDDVNALIKSYFIDKLPANDDNKKLGEQIIKDVSNIEKNISEYDMINSKLSVEVSQGVYIEYNVTATEITKFQNSKKEDLDIRKILSDITSNLDSDKPEDRDKLIGQDLQGISDILDNILKLRSGVGAKQNRMESAKERNIEENFNMTEILSEVEDIDFTENSMEAYVMQTVYMASLQASARIIQPTLMDYIR